MVRLPPMLLDLIGLQELLVTKTLTATGTVIVLEPGVPRRRHGPAWYYVDGVLVNNDGSANTGWASGINAPLRLLPVLTPFKSGAPILPARASGDKVYIDDIMVT